MRIENESQSSEEVIPLAPSDVFYLQSMGLQLIIEKDKHIKNIDNWRFYDSRTRFRMGNGYNVQYFAIESDPQRN